MRKTGDAAGIHGDFRGALKPGRNKRQVTVMAVEAWEAALPTSVTTAAAFVKSGVQAGAVSGATRISPGWSAPKSSTPRMTRTVPVTRPGDAGEPDTRAASDRLAPIIRANPQVRRPFNQPSRTTRF